MYKRQVMAVAKRKHSRLETTTLYTSLASKSRLSTRVPFFAPKTIQGSILVTLCTAPIVQTMCIVEAAPDRRVSVTWIGNKATYSFNFVAERGLSLSSQAVRIYESHAHRQT